MSTPPLVVSFVGSSGAGKTTVIEQLIPRLRVAGLRVGSVKHAPHGHEVDRVGSDSWRHRQAGAELVLLAGADGAVLFVSPPIPTPPPRGAHHTALDPTEVDDNAALEQVSLLIEHHLADVDVVLAEGFAPLHDLLVTVERADVPRKAVEGSPSVWLAITDSPSGAAHERGFDQLDDVAARVVDACRRHRRRP